MEYMREFRRDFGLDEDLEGDRVAIDSRIRSLVRARRRGEPVARVSANSWGLPLRPADERRFEFREKLLNRTVNVLDRWVPWHAGDTYAGYHVVDGKDVIIYVGFTGDQEAELARLKSQTRLFAPDHIQPFPTQPLYSERELYELLYEVVEEPLVRPLINSLGVDSLPNKVSIKTPHVAKVERLLTERFGPDAPFLVVYARPYEGW